MMKIFGCDHFVECSRLSANEPTDTLMNSIASRATLCVAMASPAQSASLRVKRFCAACIRRAIFVNLNFLVNKCLGKVTKFTSDLHIQECTLHVIQR
jgi:hypothetical protein